ncbi:MAG: hypothetical protein A4E60_00976 [Syntrophorhabdus sp. PtaB.Bin047]|jgi:hypothetical protein|nr:MAG: hypothetical protein A4E60_00976 [Syntrophorhabdus sp. PtaB.Bin047]
MVESSTLAVVVAIVTAFGTGFGCGFYAGKSQQPTITEHPHTVCPTMLANMRQNESGFTSKLIFRNGKISSVVCNVLTKRMCEYTGKRCRYL